MNGCNTILSNTAFGKNLKTRFGTDMNSALSVLNLVVKDDKFTEGFVKYVKDNYDEVVDISSDNKNLVEYAISYHNAEKPDGNATRLNPIDEDHSAYGGDANRTFAIARVADELNDIHREIAYIENALETVTKQDYIDRVQARLLTLILNRTGNDGTIPYTLIQKQPSVVWLAQINNLEKLLGDRKTKQDEVLLATAREAFDKPDMFFEEVFRNKKLQGITKNFNKDKNDNDADDNAKDNQYAQLGKPTEDNASADYVDLAFRIYESHDGQYSNFMTHIGGSLNSYLSSIRKCKTTSVIVKDKQKIYDLNTNNCIGLAECFTSSEIASILYTRSYSNIRDFVESVKDFAETHAGYEGLIILYNDLKENPDLAAECFTVFRKFVVTKKEIFRTDEGIQCRVSNTRASALESIRTTYFNNIKTTFLHINRKYIDSVIRELDNEDEALIDNMIGALDSGDVLDAKMYTTRITNLLTEAYKHILPNIDSVTILNYIIRGNNGNRKLNVTTLKKHLAGLVDLAEEMNILYNRNSYELSRARKFNNILDDYRDSNIYVDPSKYKNLDEFLAFDPISAANKNKNSLLELARELLPYTTVPVDHNSRNAAGNMSSDVINSSMISNLKDILTSELNSSKRDDSPIMRFRDYKFRSKQYNFSNILIEHTENGQIVNYGLFKEENGQYIPTEYFDQLIEFSLFNGVLDNSTNKQALYSDCTKSDYFVTAFLAFQKEKKTAIINKQTVKFGNFFLRTPSDAPKNYFFTMPIYDTFNLLRVSDSYINSYINNLKVLSFNQADAVLNTTIEKKTDVATLSVTTTGNNAIEAGPEQFARVLAGLTETIEVDDIKRLNVNKETGEAIVALRNDDITIYVKGKLENKNKSVKVVDAKLQFVKQNVSPTRLNPKGLVLPETVKLALKDVLRKEAINTNSSAVSIDRNHAIFRQMRLQFKQEMQDAASAIRAMFAHNNGNIVFDEDDKGNRIPRLKDTGKQIDKKTQLYDFYHWDGKQIVDFSDSHNPRLTGKVFHSSKFTLFNGTEEVNYLDDLIVNNRDGSGVINILYGRADTQSATSGAIIQQGNTLHFDENGVVYFTKEQQDAIDNAIEKFIKDYIDITLSRAETFTKTLEATNEEVSRENMLNFILNYRMAYYAADDLFEGSSKFYKNTQDFLKRAKEVQGSGVPYSITDITKPMFGQDRVEIGKNEDGSYNDTPNYLNSSEVQDKFKEWGIDCKAYTTFRGVTVENSKLTDEALIEQLNKQLINYFKKYNHFTEEQATLQAKAITEGYKGIKINDAQSYITFEEWIRRIAARGQLAKYMPLIEKLKTDPKSLTIDELKQFCQVQKNFYYDMYYDESMDVMAARQIKNAEFVLIPELIEGTDLEQVYDAMKAAGIDQLNTKETTKAGKSKTLRLWDNEGNLILNKKNNLNDFISQAVDAREIFDYNYLYTQQETPQHIGPDATNKFGLQISKKVIDNIPQFIIENGKRVEHPLYKYKKAIQDCLSANIVSDCSTLLKELGIPFENGHIVYDIDEETGLEKLPEINAEVFLKKLADEIIRTGATSNLMDYITPVEGGKGFDTNMPFVINSIGQKMENIAQSVFNKSITKQKLPGFHAAQITRVGFKKWINQEGKDTRDYPDNLRFRPDGEGYCEVLLPYSAFGFDPNDKKFEGKTKAEIDKILLKELEKQGLDKVIGYRIPTEAKMSSQVMKVVGFIPNEYGSTIVVPDAWVAVSGSDFDIDSVYGIQYKTKKIKIGNEEHRVKYVYKDSKDWTRGDYNRFVAASLIKLGVATKEDFNFSIDEEEFDEIKVDTRKEVKASLKEKRKAEKRVLNESEKLIWEALSDDIKDAIRQVHSEVKAIYKNESPRDIFVTQLYNEQELIKLLLKNDSFSEEEKDDLRGYGAIRARILDDILNKTDNSADYYSLYNQIKSNKVKQLLEDNNNKRNEWFAQIAKNNNLQDFDSWIKERQEDPVKYNSKNARTNHIIESMIAILEDEASLQETLAQSNFRDLIDARTWIFGEDSIIAKQRATRSCYDFIDQAEGFEDASMGMTLKGFSVAADTFCSVCNTVKPILSNPIIVYYNINDVDINSLKAAFGEENIDTIEVNGTEKIKVTHNYYGWSLNNLNVNGALITSYTAQTTAHILDAIKEGAIPNVTPKTFSIYKFFPTIGVDYKTTVGFMAQPIISRLVNKLNESESVYSDNFSRPISELREELEEEIQKQEKLLKTKNTFDKTPNPLDADALKERFNKNEESITLQDLYFDKAVLDMFEDISDVTTKITAYTMVCNPDKFGAKQSLYATEKVFDDIITMSLSDNQPFIGNFLLDIYPDANKGLDGYLNSDNNNSKYPSLHNFLKYASGISIKINSTIFPTHSVDFKEAIEYITKVFSNGQQTISEERYDDFTKYLLNYLYNQVDIIKYPVTYVKNEGVSIIKTNENTIIKERKRIYGVDREADISYQDESGNLIEFTCLDVNNPSDKEILNFTKLSPAQKVFYIQNAFRDSLIGKYLEVQTHNSAAYRKKFSNTQTVRFKENATDEEEVWESFRATFENSNPLLALTAMDLVKYSIVVEGLKMSYGAVNKIISNKILYTEQGEHGTGFIGNLKEKLSNVKAEFSDDILKKLIHSYVKANPDMKEISKTWFNFRDKTINYNVHVLPNGIIAVPFNTNTIDIAVNHKLVYETSSIKGTEYKVNPYVVVNKGKEVGRVLHKVYYSQTAHTFYLYPLNKLQDNEITEESVKRENSYWMPERYYLGCLYDYENKTDFLYTTVVENSSKTVTTQSTKTTSNQQDQTVSNIPFDINSDEFVELRRTIREHFSPTDQSFLYVWSTKLPNYIKLTAKYDKDHNIVDNGQDFELDGVTYRVHRPDINLWKYLHSPAARQIPIASVDDVYTDIIEKARKLERVNGVIPFIIRPKNSKLESIRKSDVTEDILSTFDTTNHDIARQASNGDVDAQDYMRAVWQHNGSENASTTNTTRFNASITAKFVTSSVERLLNGKHGFNYFMTNPVTGRLVPCTDNIVVNELKSNPEVRRQFLKNLLEVQHLIKTYKAFKTFIYTNETEEAKHYIDLINDAIHQLETSTIIKEAEQLYVNKYLTSVSNNPNIKAGLQSMYDTFYTTSAINAMFNDLQETGNPMLQLITSQVMSDVRAKELEGERKITYLRKKIDQIKNDAKQNGYSIDWKHLVDDAGRWLKDYDDEYILDYEDIKAERDNALNDFRELQRISNPTPEQYATKINTFRHYLNSERKLNEFLLKNTHRPLVDEYYQKHLDNEATMLRGNDFLEIYVEYKMLQDDIRVLKGSDTSEISEEEINNKIKELQNKIRSLRSSVYKTVFGDYEPKEDLTETPTGTFEEQRNAVINTLSSAVKLDEFLKKQTEINNEYFEYTDRYGIEDIIAKYKQIVEDEERKDPITGKIIKSASLRNQNPEYVKAKKWLYENTVHKYNDRALASKMTFSEADDILMHAYEGTLTELEEPLVTAAAIKYFSKTEGHRANKSTKYKEIAKRSGAYDEYGVLDARKLSEEDIATIKAEQEKRYGIGEDSEYSERRILHSSTLDNTVYTDTFWKNMNAGGVNTTTYNDVCKECNKILRTILNSSTGVLETWRLSTADIDSLLNQFKRLGYDTVEKTFNHRNSITKKTGVSKLQAKAAKLFINKYVEFVLSDEDKINFNYQEAQAANKGELYYNLWKTLNYEYDEDADTFIPNHILWGHAQPKEEYKDLFIAKLKTQAIRTLAKSFTENPSSYYEEEHKRMLAYGKESPEYRDWFDRNHIYNPRTQSMEPLVCWMTSEPTSDTGSYEPNFVMKDKNIKRGYKNPNYNEKMDYRYNYKNNGNIYQRSYTINPYERQLKSEIQRMLHSLVKTKQGKDFIAMNGLPFRAKHEALDTPKAWAKEFLKGFGYIEQDHGENRWHDRIGYDYDYVPNMPMTTMLSNKDSVFEPKVEDYTTIEEYNAAKANYDLHKDEIEKKNLEIHKQLLDTNVEDVVLEFIRQATHFNAIQDNKLSLYFAQEFLNRQQMYVSHRLGLDKYRVNHVTEETTVYETAPDKRLQEQYNVWLHRLLLNEYKKPQGAATKITNLMQSITSNIYMTINLRGGIANMTVGEANIMGEWFASEYLGKSDWLAGKGSYFEGLPSCIADAYSETATSLQSAIIKTFDVVEYSQLRGVDTAKDLAKAMEKVRDFAYFPQTSTEHFMQNSVLLAMMKSHKVVSNPKFGEAGEPKYLIVNKEEYLRGSEEEALRQICTEEEFNAYKQFIAYIKRNPNLNRKYAAYRQNTITNYVIGKLKNKLDLYNETVENIRKHKEEEFNNNPDLYSQFKLDEVSGTLDFADNSRLKELHNDTIDKEVSDAYTLMGKFKQRVISVNQKIHGNYGKLDAAKIESEWYGGLVMQYHKHIVPGFMKRWRTQGYFNETRGTIEKGSYISLYDMLSVPVDQLCDANNIPLSDRNALKSIQTVLTNITDYCQYVVLNFKTMPQWEKANCMRAVADIAGMLIAMTVAVMARIGWDDDDDSFAYNFILYEADRMYSEINMWNPVGAVNEVKTLYSTPIACQSIVTDIFNVAENLSGLILEGEDYEPNFKTGRYAGQNKLFVYGTRRIPYYRQYVSLRDIAANNRYYKRTSSFIDTVPKTIANYVKGKNN